MDDLERLVARQDGVVRRDQALTGLSPSALRHRLRPGGPWTRLLPAVYLTSTGTPTRRQLLRAALLHAGARAQLGGPTALELHGLPGPRLVAVHVLVPHDARPVSRQGVVVVHRTHRLPRPRWVQGLPSSPTARAVVDAARLLDDRAQVRALVAASVQRRRTSVEQLQRELAEGHSAGSGHARAVLAEVAAGVRSEPEGRLRALLRTSEVLPEAVWNGRLLLHGRWLADPDAWFPEAGLAVECDSRTWHLLPEHWEATLARHDRMTAAGLRVLHVTPQRLAADPQQVLRTVEQAYLAGRRTGPPPGVRVLATSATATAAP